MEDAIRVLELEFKKITTDLEFISYHLENSKCEKLLENRFVIYF